MGTTNKTKSTSTKTQRIQPPAESPSAPAAVNQPPHEAIAVAAFGLYAASGFVDGNDEENWLRAEAELRAKSPTTPRS